MKVFFPKSIDLPDSVPVAPLLAAFRRVGLELDHFGTGESEHEEVHMREIEGAVPLAFWQRPKNPPKFLGVALGARAVNTEAGKDSSR